MTLRKAAPPSQIHVADVEEMSRYTSELFFPLNA